MSLLDKIKSVLGMDSSGDSDASGRASDGGGVTVERERGDTATEDAVKGTDTVEASPGAETESPTDEDAAAAGERVDTDAGVEPSEVVGEASTDTGEVAEPSEATGPTSQETEPEPGEVAEDDEAEPDAGGESPTVIKGIGPAYAETLAEAGVESVADLAAADAADLSTKTDISEKRLERWIGRAKHR